MLLLLVAAIFAFALGMPLAGTILAGLAVLALYYE